MAYPFVDKKILVIKANWFLPLLTWHRLHSRTVCFNKHFELAWAVMPQTEC